MGRTDSKREKRSITAVALDTRLGPCRYDRAIGPASSGFAPGDEVFGATNPRFVGAYATYAVATVAMIAKKPAALDFTTSAAVPVVAVTALQMLKRIGLTAGQTILIHGAAGSVGAYAVQIAHRLGARVVGTAFHADADYLRSLGASDVIDVEKARFEEAVDPVDAVLDMVGGEVQSRSFAILKRGGHLVSIVSSPDRDQAAAHGVTPDFFFVNVNTSDLNEISGMLDSGELRTRVGTVLPLEQAREAHEMLSGVRPHPSGKIVLRTGDRT